MIRSMFALISLLTLSVACAPAPPPDTPDNGLLLALAVLEKGADGRPVPQPAELGILTDTGAGWTYEAISDPDSNVSKLTRERNGYSLMPEAGCQPTWQYLPPVVRKSGAESKSKYKPAVEHANADAGQLEVTATTGFLGWVDRMLTR